MTNQTVERIVGLLFQDVADSAEVQAIRDEVMTNCQEHFEDLVAHGMTEDEAIAAVVESLKGMEEVLSQYPRKQTRQETAAADDGTDGERHIVTESKASMVNVDVRSWDVVLEHSTDGMIHINCLDGDSSTLDIRFDDEKVVIRERDDENGGHHSFEVHWEAKDVRWESFGEMMKDLGRNVVDKIKDTLGPASGGYGTIQLKLPLSVVDVNAKTISGDVAMAGLMLNGLNAATRSGDVTLDKVQARTIDLRTTSGDVDVKAQAAERAGINSTSGDVSFSGACPDVGVNTVSGDVDVALESGDARKLRVNTVSGDVDVNAESERIEAIDVNTTSGDIQVVLPRQTPDAHVSVKTVSGDVRNRFPDAGSDARVQVRALTVSGDIDIL